MQKYQRHIVFWVLIYVVWTYIRGSQESSYDTYLIINLVQLSMYMTAYYILKHIQIPYFFDRGNVVLFALSLLASSIVIYLYWRVLGVTWLDELGGYNRSHFCSLSGYLSQTVQVFAPAMILFTWESYNERQKEIDRMHQLEKEKISTELKFLKAQINPHFLFNTLNNLYSNVIIKSPKAPDMVMQLSGILDYVLYKSQNKTVPLSEEVRTIENFLGLEKIRYGKRLEVEYKAGEHIALPISPLILLSIVENAFKHGASGDIDSPKIKIDIFEKDDNIYCNVWNTKSKYTGELNDSYKKGIGLKNIKRQLNLIYPKNHTLIIEEGGNTFNVMLTINPVI